MINALVIATSFALLALQGMLHHILISQWLYPSLVLPVVLYMSVGEFSLARGASLAFVLGYLADAFLGLPMGLNTFCLVAIFLLARVLGLKLFLHGWVFQILLTFVASMVVGAMMLFLHALFEPAQSRPALAPAIAVVAAQGAMTALLSPLVFALVRKLPGAETPKPEET